MRKRFFLTLLLGLFCTLMQAQVEENKVFDMVDQMPSFPGDMEALASWLGNNIKYPVVAEENGVQGKVVCSFVVERDGSITDVRVVRGVDPSLDREAVRVLKQMPHWIPGKQNGSAVRVKCTLPVTFSLQSTDDKPTYNSHDNTDTVYDNDFVYEKADVVPTYPGGEAEFRNIASKTIIYPEMAENYNVDGVVQMNFVVEKDGSISNAVPKNCRVTTYGNTAENVSKTCSKLFVDAVKEGLKKIPRFTPATIDGQPVKFRMMLVVVFGAEKNDVPTSPTTMCVYVKGRNSVKNLYMDDKKPYKDMHLYLVGNEYYVSGINKQISALSSEDVTTINKKSKDVASDILKKHGEKEGNDVVYDLTSNNAHKDISRPQLKTPNGLDEYMKENLSHATDKVSVVVSFIVETDGHISCPVVEQGNELKAVKNVIHCLRKTEGWQPAVKDGVPVRSRISHFFSYKTVVTTVQRSVPVYGRPNSTFDDYRRRRGF